MGWSPSANRVKENSEWDKLHFPSPVRSWAAFLFWLDSSLLDVRKTDGSGGYASTRQQQTWLRRIHRSVPASNWTDGVGHLAPPLTKRRLPLTGNERLPDSAPCRADQGSNPK